MIEIDIEYLPFFIEFYGVAPPLTVNLRSRNLFWLFLLTQKVQLLLKYYNFLFSDSPKSSAGNLRFLKVDLFRPIHEDLLHLWFWELVISVIMYGVGHEK